MPDRQEDALAPTTDHPAGGSRATVRAKRSSLIAVLVALLLTTLFTLTLQFRASVSDAVVRRDPLPVSAAQFTEQAGYQRERSFLGLVRAGRVSNLGFERSGLVSELQVREGSEVQRGDVLASLDTARLTARRDAMAADLERVQAELELARLQETRQLDLQSTGAVSEAAVDETRLGAKALAAQLANVRSQLRGLEIDLEKSVLRAPYAGTVAQRLVESGAVVNAGSTVLRLVAADRREAHIGVAVEQTQMLRPGERYSLALRDVTFTASLRSIRPDVDPRTLTATAVFDLPAEVNGLEGEPVELRLAETVNMLGGWIPLSALIEGERGLWTVMQLVDQEGVLVTSRQLVEVLDVQGSRAFVRGSLPDGAGYIADGVHRIALGTPVVAIDDTVAALASPVAEAGKTVEKGN